MRVTDFYGDAGAWEGDWKQWRFFECRSSDGYDLTLGLSGYEAALFHCEGNEIAGDFYNFDERLRALKDPETFRNWLGQL